jgi:hypothetical protein
MARVCTYLNFPRNTEEVFNYYKSIFGGEFSGDGIFRMKDNPAPEGMPELGEKDKNLIMHIELPILGGHVLMVRILLNQWDLLSISEIIFTFISNPIQKQKQKGCLKRYLAVVKLQWS